MIEAKDWDHVAVIILGPQMPREKDVAMLYFQEVLHTSPPSRCPHLQGMMQREVHHQRLIYAESITTEEGALALLKTHMTDEKLGEVILRNSMAMHQDVLGPSAEGYLKSLRLQKL